MRRHDADGRAPTAPARPLALRLTAAVAAVVTCWILVSPPSAGPDEPGHVVYAAGIVRGDIAGTPHPDDPARHGFDVPAWVGTPDPACWTQKLTVPAACAADQPTPDEGPLIYSRVADSPVWGHLLPGLATFGPASWSTWTARVLSAALPVALVGAALGLAARRGRLAVSAVLLSLTPMGWFMFAVVNPSGLAIAGGLAMWADGVVEERRRPGWLTALGWAAVALPRRDGLVWASFILIGVLLTTGRRLRGWWGDLSVGPRRVVVLSTFVAWQWALTSDLPIIRLAVLAPLCVLAADWLHGAFRTHITTTGRRIAVGTAVALAVTATMGVLLSRRSGIDTAGIAGRTGQHLEEAIGVLGWVDTPLPTTGIHLWLLGLGILAAAALIGDGWRPITLAGGIVGAAVIASWTVQLVHEATLGPYWQGRYYLPLLLGVPILLSRVRLDAKVEQRLALIVTILSVAVWNMAFVAAVRRWSVGVSGPLRPWEWGDYGVPLPPTALIVAHALLSVTLAVAVHRATSPPSRRRARPRMQPVPAVAAVARRHATATPPTPLPAPQPVARARPASS